MRTLGELFKFGSGKVATHQDDGEFPIFGANGVVGSSAAPLYESGIILGRVGAYCGSVHYSLSKFWATDNTIVAKPLSEELLDEKFGYYLLSQMNLNRYAGGSAQPLLTQTVLKKLEVTVPPLPTQRKIAAILSAYDDLIENNTRRVRVLEDMARALYREWFVEYRYPGHETAEFTEDEQGRRPKGWEWGTFSDAAVVFSTSVNPSNFPEEEFEHFSLPAFDAWQLPIVELGETIKSNKNRIPNDCVLLPKLNPRIPRVWLPPASRGGRQIASTEFLPLLPSRGYSKQWLYCLCSAPEFLGRLASMASGTSTSHQRISPKGLAILPLALPTPAVVQRFTAAVAPALEMTVSLRQRNANLRRTRDLLLPRLVSGELDVSGLDIRGAAEDVAAEAEAVA